MSGCNKRILETDVRYIQNHNLLSDNEIKDSKFYICVSPGMVKATQNLIQA
jgi:hypothetical protein